MKIVGTTEAAFLLGISVSRLRVLLKENRVRDAKKVGRVWVIPLFNRMPKVTRKKKGPKGKWRVRLSTQSTLIHVDRTLIASNLKNHTTKPVISVKEGSRNHKCHLVEIQGASRVIYQPDSPLGCGARVWIEVAPDIVVVPKLL